MRQTDAADDKLLLRPAMAKWAPVPRQIIAHACWPHKSHVSETKSLPTGSTWCPAAAREWQICRRAKMIDRRLKVDLRRQLRARPNRRDGRQGARLMGAAPIGQLGRARGPAGAPLQPAANGQSDRWPGGSWRRRRRLEAPAMVGAETGARGALPPAPPQEPSGAPAGRPNMWANQVEWARAPN